MTADGAAMWPRFIQRAFTRLTTDLENFPSQGNSTSLSGLSRTGLDDEGELDDEETSRAARGSGSDVCCNPCAAGECDVAGRAGHGCSRRSCEREHDHGGSLSPSLASPPPLASASSLASPSPPLASPPLVSAKADQRTGPSSGLFRFEACLVFKTIGIGIGATDVLFFASGRGHIEGGFDDIQSSGFRS